MSEPQTATRAELAQRYGVSYTAVRNWIRMPDAPRPSAPGPPERYPVAAFDRFREAFSLPSEIPGCETVSQLARRLGRSRSTVIHRIQRHQEDCPPVRGMIRVTHQAVPVYGIDEFLGWYEKRMRGEGRGGPGEDARSVLDDASTRLVARPAHGTEGRWKRHGCRCPVCQSARATSREALRGGRERRVDGALERLAKAMLDPGADPGRLIAVARVLRNPQRLAVLRAVASMHPDPAPALAVERHLGEMEQSPVWEFLEESGLIERADVAGLRAYRWALSTSGD